MRNNDQQQQQQPPPQQLAAAVDEEAGAGKFQQLAAAAVPPALVAFSVEDVGMEPEQIDRYDELMYRAMLVDPDLAVRMRWGKNGSNRSQNLDNGTTAPFASDEEEEEEERDTGAIAEPESADGETFHPLSGSGNMSEEESGSATSKSPP